MDSLLIHSRCTTSVPRNSRLAFHYWCNHWISRITSLSVDLVIFTSSLFDANGIPAWAVFVNTLDDAGVSDLVLTTVVLVLFGLGFLLGVLELSRVVGILLLGTIGGFSLGIRIVLMRSGLLISDPSIFFVNWLIVGLCGFSSSILVVWKQRVGVVSSEHGELCCCSPMPVSI